MKRFPQELLDQIAFYLKLDQAIALSPDFAAVKIAKEFRFDDYCKTGLNFQPILQVRFRVSCYHTQFHLGRLLGQTRYYSRQYFNQHLQIK